MTLTFSVSGGPGRARFVVDGKTWSQNQVIGYVASHSEYVYSTRKPVQLMLLPDGVTAVSESKNKLEPEQLMSLSVFLSSLSAQPRASSRKKQVPVRTVCEHKDRTKAQKDTVKKNKAKKDTAKKDKATKDTTKKDKATKNKTKPQTQKQT
jgi:hypothetical protein